MSDEVESAEEFMRHLDSDLTEYRRTLGVMLGRPATEDAYVRFAATALKQRDRAIHNAAIRAAAECVELKACAVEEVTESPGLRKMGEETCESILEDIRELLKPEPKE